MGPQAKAVLLSVLIHPTFLLTPESQDLPSVEPIPILNLKFDPRRMTLTWDCQESATDINCVMMSKEKEPVTVKPMEKECHCTFQSSFLHGGVTFVVTVNINQTQITDKVFYTNPGGEGTAAQDFSCFIYNANFMNCTWAKGPAAPDDVQYFLYIQDIYTKRESECPHYTNDSGTHVGCHLDDLVRFPSKIYFLVNGTSQRAGIQFFDTILLLNKIERYSPPHNITVHCNRSHCLIRWDRPGTRRKRSDKEFQYQLDIQSQHNKPPSGRQLIEIPGDLENKYNFLSPEPRAKHTVRIRTADARVQQWGDWSPLVAFGSEERKGSRTHIYVLVVLGTLVGALIIGCLFKRFWGRHHLFPPVPRIKDVLNENHQTDHQVIWETPGAEKGSNEEVLTIEEVAESTESL